MNCKKCGTIVNSTDLFCAGCGEKQVRDNKKYYLLIVSLLICNLLISFIVSKKIVYFVKNNYRIINGNGVGENIQSIPDYNYSDDYQFNDDFFNDFFGY